ncbi:MAG: hypothetical protein RRB13_01655 [bacterium]|nr:hypothetical protein [bacterium]
MTEPPRSNKAPFQLMQLMSTAFGQYRAQILPLLVLSLVSFLPFWAISQFSQFDLGDLSELFHGFLLDILVFLALPTLLSFNRIYPIETLKIFTNFFASSILVVLLQVFGLFFLLLFFSGFGLPFMFFGLVPFIFILFVGQFSLVNNAPKMLELKDNFIDSVLLIRKHFWAVFVAYLNLSTLMILPILIFSLVYMRSHPEFVKLTDTTGPMDGTGLFEAIQAVMNETGYQMGRMGIHLVFRPFKALVMGLILAKLLEQSMPEKHAAYFNITEPPAEDNPSIEQSWNPKE